MHHHVASIEDAPYNTLTAMSTNGKLLDVPPQQPHWNGRNLGWLVSWSCAPRIDQTWIDSNILFFWYTCPKKTNTPPRIYQPASGQLYSLIDRFGKEPHKIVWRFDDNVQYSIRHTADAQTNYNRCRWQQQLALRSRRRNVEQYFRCAVSFVDFIVVTADQIPPQLARPNRCG